MLLSRNSSKFRPFHSKSLIQKRTKEQTKAIKQQSVKQRNEISKVADINQLRLSSSDSCKHDHLAPRQYVDKTDAIAPSLSSSETVHTSSLRTELTSEASLKSRLRATTRALSAAVIKEQQMFATRSVAKQLFVTNKEDEADAVVDSGKKMTKTRLTRSTVRNSKDQMQLNTTSNIACSKDAQKEKKLEMANRLRSGTVIGCESTSTITDLNQPTAEVSQQVTSTNLFGRGLCILLN